MNDDRASRILKVSDHLGVTKHFIATQSGIGPSNFNKMLDGQQTITDKTLRKIADAFPQISYGWLRTGDGGMLLDTKSDIADENHVSNAELVGAVKRPHEGLLRRVKMYSVTHTATFTELSACFQDDTSYIWMLPEPGEYIDDSYAIFEIRGESMEPTVRDHSRILCKQLPESRWQDAEGVIVISFKDMVVLKRVVKNSFYTDNCITLASDNTDPKYSHIEKVQIADVHAIFKAKRILSQDIN